MIGLSVIFKVDQLCTLGTEIVNGIAIYEILVNKVVVSIYFQA